MKHSRAAIRYAKAVLSLSLDLKNADKINDDMQSIATTIEGSKELQVMLSSPVIKTKAKKAALLSVFKNLNKTSISLIDQLIDNKRLPILGQIAKQYILIYDLHKGAQVAKVTTAVPLTKVLEEKVLAKVKEIVGKKVNLENIIDPSIIGGFILRVGDKQFDASISGKINNLRREFEHNLYVPKF
ncbi:ATP synthase F1 subunit delta [Aureibaculum sp. 2210JD6-5]|uniref:ATP synthase F1 subunit delta n=1 Tax=Aureibaculum sp. 2210JD6-5 TaxID=3103957 RepID=UPI002AAD3673|nr:ATP synthase F1 subunit delta [Aureibaculum sp. 2210JD6-5]MDY7394498.1 ATP synthase F1 subunit delta [Aureibaculum sp. 2210JD6-5]